MCAHTGFSAWFLRTSDTLENLRMVSINKFFVHINNANNFGMYHTRDMLCVLNIEKHLLFASVAASYYYLFSFIFFIIISLLFHRRRHRRRFARALQENHS